MENIIEKIHNEFNVAADKLIKLSKDYKHSAKSIKNPDENQTVIEDGEFLEQIGFENVPTTKKYKKYKKIVHENIQTKNSFSYTSEKIKEDVKRYSDRFPFNKFILYSQVIEILEKYNLYIGHSSLYTGEIPKKNINEMKNFPFNKLSTLRISNKLPLYLHNGGTYKSDTYIDKNTKNFFTSDPYKSIYICAPKQDFNLKGTLIIGKELIKDGKFEPLSLFESNQRYLAAKKVKDPIVLVPVSTDLDQLGFIVITKWGLEAEDESLIVPRNN